MLNVQMAMCDKNFSKEVLNQIDNFLIEEDIDLETYNEELLIPIRYNGNFAISLKNKTIEIYPLHSQSDENDDFENNINFDICIGKAELITEQE